MCDRVSSWHVSDLTSDGDTFIETIPIIGTQLAGPTDEQMKEEEQIRKKERNLFTFPFLCKKRKKEKILVDCYAKTYRSR